MYAQNSPGSSQLHRPRAEIGGPEGEDPVVAQLGNDCSVLYTKLETCLAESNRNWKLCQKGELEHVGIGEGDVNIVNANMQGHLHVA